MAQGIGHKPRRVFRPAGSTPMLGFRCLLHLIWSRLWQEQPQIHTGATDSYSLSALIHALSHLLSLRFRLEASVVTLVKDETHSRRPVIAFS
jgi:hypothetical protein